jgi:hypothetical protein
LKDYNSTISMLNINQESPADYMSRHPDMKSTMFKHAEIAEHYVHYISEARHSYIST